MGDMAKPPPEGASPVVGFMYVNCVGDPTEVIPNDPLYPGSGMPKIVTGWPLKNPCGAAVVTVTKFPDSVAERMVTGGAGCVLRVSSTLIVLSEELAVT